MDDWDFIELDSGKGEKLLDIAAYRQWRLEKNQEVDESDDKEQALEEMRAEVATKYAKLKEDIATLTLVQARRLYQYLQGESLRQIAESEAPSVNHKQIERTLKKICKKWGWDAEQFNQAKLIWVYGQSYLE